MKRRKNFACCTARWGLGTLFLLGVAAAAGAMLTPRQMQEKYENLAREAQTGYAASTARGEELFRAKRRHSKGESVGCTTCHTDDPKATGLTRARKKIEPLAPVANPERFTDTAKVEKWFTRNCDDVLERPCTPQEKADFISFLLSVK
jgi:cytochrome c peroxidase